MLRSSVGSPKPEPQPVMNCTHPAGLNHCEDENEKKLDDQKKRNKDESKKKNQQQEDHRLILATTPPPPSSLDHDNAICNINKAVPNDILIEILARLNQNHAIQCKLVCKEWYSLISNPIFTDCIIHHHPRLTLLFRTKYGFGFSGAFVEKGEQERCLEAIITNEQCHQEAACNKITIPQSVKLTATTIAVTSSFWLMASCMDHFLFCYKTLDTLHYIIYNPLTNQCRVIPPINYPRRDEIHHFVSGFFCVPRHSIASSAAPATPTGIYHYKVVSISTREKDFDVLLFCSQANKWEKHKVSCPHNVNVTPRCYAHIIAYRQKLHWTTYGSCTKALVVYDPLRYPRKISQLIDFPAWEDAADDDHDGNVRPPLEQHLVYRLGVCKDRLRISLVIGCFTKRTASWRSYANYNNPVIVIWELRDYENPSHGWNRIFKIYVVDHSLVVLDRVRITRPIYLRQNFTFKRQNSAMNGVVAFHPTDDDLVYVLRS